MKLLLPLPVFFPFFSFPFSYIFLGLQGGTKVLRHLPMQFPKTLGQIER